ncbi:MAG: hypothetical protein IJS80_01685 [Lachnospiraceae bacterium]|nr:hypothetical protein [Lachnospiraceae bacterium]
MDKEKISDALSYLDDDIIEETEKLRQRSAKSRSSKLAEFTRRPWFKTALAAAAVIVILIGGGAVAGNMHLKKKERSADINMIQKSALMKDMESRANEETDSTGFSDSLDPQESKYLDQSATSYPATVSDNSGISKGGFGGSNSLGDYDLSYISTTCVVSRNDESVSGSYSIDLSEKADYYLETGEAWSLEILKDDSWEYISPKSEQTWNQAVYGIGKFAGTGHLERTFNLNAYGTLKKGKYRIAKNIYVFKTVDGKENVYNDTVYCEFELND